MKILVRKQRVSLKETSYFSTGFNIRLLDLNVRKKETL